MSARPARGPFDDPALAASYEGWYAGRGRRADRFEKRTLARLLAGMPRAASMLEIGCGTGHFTRWLAEGCARVVGLDASRAMLAEAAWRDGIPYVRGDAEALPFPDRSFDLVALVTALEFVADPERALREAVRVARSGLLVGALNRWSFSALRRRIAARPPWSAARFLAPRELSRLVRGAAGGRLASARRSSRWRAFVGMAVTLEG